MRPTKFLRIYHDLAKSLAHPDDLEELYWDLKFSFDNDEKVGHWFQKSSPTSLDKGIAIDAVAHAIHTEVKKGEGTFLHRAFPGASVSTFREALDTFAGMEKSSEVRKINRGYYSPLLATEGLIFLAKQEAGQSSKEDIKDAIAEYERLFTAGVGSPAELLTLYRYYGPKSKYAQPVKEQGLLEDENEPLVVGGPASVEGIDHENHLITTKALDVAFDAFMKNFRTRNCMVFHSDVQTGWALPAYITKTGLVFKSGVDENGFFLVSELRSDTRVAKRLIEEIIEGNILSYSIAGSATDIQVISKGVQRFMQVDALELAEVTYCVLPDTKVWTTTNSNKGEVPSLKLIRLLKEGDKVLTHNMQFKEITKILKREVKKEQIYVLINAHGKELHVTGEHPILILTMTEGEQWVAAKDVIVGNTVKIMDEHKDFSTSEIVEIKTPRKKYNGDVYNLEVADDNSYITAAMAIHNCERGVNQGAHFNILKSFNEANTFVALPSVLPVVTLDIYRDGDEVIIKADQESSITDEAYLELRKSIPADVTIRILDTVSDDAVLLNKEYETNWYNHTVSNYPEFNNIPFQNFVSDKSGYKPKDFKKITRPEMDRIAVDYQKDAGAIKPEFSSAYVQKEINAGERYPEFAWAIEGSIFQKQDPKMKERYKAVNYKHSTVEGKECHTCIFFSEGYCTKIHLPVKQEMTCDEYKPMPGAMEAEAWAERSGKPYEQEVSKMSKKDEFMEILKQWQDPKMEYASDHKQMEKDRRTRLEKFQNELGYPEEVVHDQDKGFPEVEEDDTLPWNKTSGVIDKS